VNEQVGDHCQRARKCTNLTYHIKKGVHFPGKLSLLFLKEQVDSKRTVGILLIGIFFFCQECVIMPEEGNPVMEDAILQFNFDLLQVHKFVDGFFGAQ